MAGATMKKTQRTKKIALTALILSIISILLSIGPLVFYSAKAFITSTSTTNKCILLSMISIGTILSIVCLINKYTPRCRIWLIVIGLYLCLDSILGTILVIAITQVLDELLVAPMARKYREKLHINKEMDIRLNG